VVPGTPALENIALVGWKNKISLVTLVMKQENHQLMVKSGRKK
jgi:hypothetical protein